MLGDGRLIKSTSLRPLFRFRFNINNIHWRPLLIYLNPLTTHNIFTFTAFAYLNFALTEFEKLELSSIFQFNAHKLKGILPNRRSAVIGWSRAPRIGVKCCVVGKARGNSNVEYFTPFHRSHLIGISWNLMNNFHLKNKNKEIRRTIYPQKTDFHREIISYAI